MEPAGWNLCPLKKNDSFARVADSRVSACWVFLKSLRAVGKSDDLAEAGPNLDVLSVQHLFGGGDCRRVVIDVDFSGSRLVSVCANKVSSIIWLGGDRVFVLYYRWSAFDEPTLAREKCPK